MNFTSSHRLSAFTFPPPLETSRNRQDALSLICFCSDTVTPYKLNQFSNLRPSGKQQEPLSTFLNGSMVIYREKEEKKSGGQDVYHGVGNVCFHK